MIAAVIGSQYGDEGKGLVTDYLARPETLVVRYNGGAQAGHTVTGPSGRRHEFHSPRRPADIWGCADAPEPVLRGEPVRFCS